MLMQLRQAIALTLTMLVASVAGVGSAGPSAALAAECHGADAVPASASTETLRLATACLIDRERTRRGLRRLDLDPRLTSAAARHARDMVDRSYFAHASRSGSTPAVRIRRTGYLRAAAGWRVGEILAWGTDERSSPRAVVAAWMASPRHRANLLGSFHDVGIGVADDAPRHRGRVAGTYVAEFGLIRGRWR